IVVISFMLVLLFACSGFSGQPATKPFVKKITGIGRLVTAIQTRDRNYVTVNHLSNAGCTSNNCPIFTISKLTPSGGNIWKTSFTITGDNDGVSVINAIAETNDGYVLVGSRPIGGYYSRNFSGLLMKMDLSGKIVWEKSLTPGHYFTSVAT